MIKDLVKKNRSIRNFVPNEYIGCDTLKELIDITRFCPSSANVQPLKYRAVYEKSECDEVFRHIKFAGYLPKGTVPEHGHECTGYIVIGVDRDIAANVEPFLKDTGIVAQSIMLYAAEKGLGGCMIGSFDEDEIKAALKLKESYKITLILALGYPDEKVELVDCADGNIKYYRENGIHYVPKRSLEDILL